MHSFGYKTVALLTFAVAARVLMCATASFSCKFSYRNKIQVNLKLNITPELQSSFISFLDNIPAEGRATFRIQNSNNDRFSHQGHNIPGEDFNLTLQWHVREDTC